MADCLTVGGRISDRRYPDATGTRAWDRGSVRTVHVVGQGAGRGPNRVRAGGARFAELLAKIDERFAQVDARFDASRDELKRELAERFEAHARWMMGGWAIIFAALIANFFRR